MLPRRRAAAPAAAWDGRAVVTKGIARERAATMLPQKKRTRSAIEEELDSGGSSSEGEAAQHADILNAEENELDAEPAEERRVRLAKEMIAAMDAVAARRNQVHVYGGLGGDVVATELEEDAMRRAGRMCVNVATSLRGARFNSDDVRVLRGPRLSPTCVAVAPDESFVVCGCKVRRLRGHPRTCGPHAGRWPTFAGVAASTRADVDLLSRRRALLVCPKHARFCANNLQRHFPDAAAGWRNRAVGLAVGEAHQASGRALYALQRGTRGGGAVDARRPPVGRTFDRGFGRRAADCEWRPRPGCVAVGLAHRQGGTGV